MHGLHLLPTHPTFDWVGDSLGDVHDCTGRRDPGPLQSPHCSTDCRNDAVHPGPVQTAACSIVVYTATLSWPKTRRVVSVFGL